MNEQSQPSTCSESDKLGSVGILLKGILCFGFCVSPAPSVMPWKSWGATAASSCPRNSMMSASAGWTPSLLASRWLWSTLVVSKWPVLLKNCLRRERIPGRRFSWRTQIPHSVPRWTLWGPRSVQQQGLPSWQRVLMSWAEFCRAVWAEIRSTFHLMLCSLFWNNSAT